MFRDTSQEENLSTVGSIDPYKVINLFDIQNIVLVAVEIEARGKRTGKLPEKGAWIKKVWNMVLTEMPEAEGCRLLWNRVFFAFPSQDVEALKEKFRKLLQELFDSSLESFCIISEAEGTVENKIRLLDDLEHEI